MTFITILNLTKIKKSVDVMDDVTQKATVYIEKDKKKVCLSNMIIMTLLMTQVAVMIVEKMMVVVMILVLSMILN